MVSNTPLIIYVLLQLKRQLFPPINWTITINDIIPMCVDHILPRLVQVVQRTRQRIECIYTDCHFLVSCLEREDFLLDMGIITRLLESLKNVKLGKSIKR